MQSPNSTIGYNIQHQVTLVHSPDETGCTPLHCAAAGGHLNICRVLVDAGARTSRLDHNGRSPAEYARSAGHLHVFTSVFEFHYTCFCRVTYVTCFFSWTVDYRYLAAVDTQEREVGCASLFRAASLGRELDIQRLVADGHVDDINDQVGLQVYCLS